MIVLKKHQRISMRKKIRRLRDEIYNLKMELDGKNIQLEYAKGRAKYYSEKYWELKNQNKADGR